MFRSTSVRNPHTIVSRGRVLRGPRAGDVLPGVPTLSLNPSALFGPSGTVVFRENLAAGQTVVPESRPERPAL